VLLVEDNPDSALLVRHSLSVSRQTAFQVKVVPTLAAALEAIAHQRFDAVLLDLNLPDSRGLATFQKVREAAGELIVIVLTAMEDESVATEAITHGAADFLIKGELGGEGLARRVRFAIERSRVKPAAERSGAARIITVVGCKGGMGTSTLAINLSAVFSRKRKKTLLVEWRTGGGSLAAILGVNPVYTLDALLPGEGPQPIENVILALNFGARLVAASASLEAATWDNSCAESLLQQLAGLADFVVIDASLQMPQLAKAAIARSAFTVLVVDREQTAVQLASKITQDLNIWAGRPNAIGAALVTHAPFVDSAPLPEIRKLLNCGVVGVIPPARDAIQSFRRMGPIVLSQPEMPVSLAFDELAGRLEQEPVRFVTG